jgi:hypothetical protein
VAQPSLSAAWADAAEAFLRDLITVQEGLLAELTKRRQRPVTVEHDASGVTADQQTLLERLEHCRTRRAELLQSAATAGRKAQTLRTAVAALADRATGRRLQALVADAESAARRLRLEGMTHWMLAQRSLAHVGQLLEILATVTPQSPTYGNGVVSTARGGLLDEAA